MLLVLPISTTTSAVV